LRLRPQLNVPLVVSLAAHAALLGAVGPGGSNSAFNESHQAALQVRFARHGEASVVAPVSKPAPMRAEGARVALPLASRYFRSSELDQSAVPIELAPLVYPERELVNRIRGTVRLRIFISASGVVERSEIVVATPIDRFEQAATDAIKATRFRPGIKSGRAVASEKLIEVEFDPYGPRPEEGR